MLFCNKVKEKSTLANFRNIFLIFYINFLKPFLRSVWDLAEYLERLTCSQYQKSQLSSDTMESEGRQMKKCWIKYRKKLAKMRIWFSAKIFAQMQHRKFSLFNPNCHQTFKTVVQGYYTYGKSECPPRWSARKVRSRANRTSWRAG